MTPKDLFTHYQENGILSADTTDLTPENLFLLEIVRSLEYSVQGIKEEEFDAHLAIALADTELENTRTIRREPEDDLATLPGVNPELLFSFEEDFNDDEMVVQTPEFVLAFGVDSEARQRVLYWKRVVNRY